MRTYGVGDSELDRQVKELVGQASRGANGDLITEIITTALKLYRDAPDRGDLKLINTALKEMRYSMLVFSKNKDQPKVTIFGSARTPEDDRNYRLAVEFARIMAHERDWAVITGAGPGIMQAGNQGAGVDASYGVSIRLPFEANSNPYIAPNRMINFKYFFTRKLGFVKESNAFALFPGGFGTMDESFELLTLVQTGKSDPHPIVMLEAPGTGYWQGWQRFIDEQLVAPGLIAPEDRSLYLITNDPYQAADEICDFYSNYHSQRYVSGRLVLRLLKAPDAGQLERLNDEFADIVAEGRMEVVPPSPPEEAEGDALHCERLAFTFDRRHFSRLRKLIDALNELVAGTPEHVQPPPPFREDQQERAW